MTNKLIYKHKFMVHVLKGWTTSSLPQLPPSPDYGPLFF